MLIWETTIELFNESGDDSVAIEEDALDQSFIYPVFPRCMSLPWISAVLDLCMKLPLDTLSALSSLLCGSGTCYVTGAKLSGLRHD